MSPSLSRLQLRHWTLVAAAAIAGTTGGHGGGVLLGGGAIGLSVAAYGVALDALVRRGRRRLAIGILFVKLAALLGLGSLALASRRFHPDPIGFAVGVSCFPVAAVWEAMRARGA